MADACSHPEIVDGRCTRCGVCTHDVILNGACYFCGATDIQVTVRPLRDAPSIVPVDRLRRRRPSGDP
jgi:hypothetical protein